MDPIQPPDFQSQQFKANPYPYFARLRAEAPVYPFKSPFGSDAWLVTRYDDVAVALKHPGLSKDQDAFMAAQKVRGPMRWLLKLFAPLSQNMLNKDPPDHTRLRSLVHKAFTPKLVERLRGRVQTLADGLLDQALARGSMELVKDYALPIPITIIAEMLGVPAKDSPKFQRWSNRLVANTRPIDVVLSVPALLRFRKYLEGLIAQRRASPGDDLLSALIQAEEAGDKLSSEELISMVFLLLVAGHETTVNLIAGGALALLQHPEQRERLKRDPGLIETAVEELLRFTSPVEMATVRFATEDVSLGGATIRRGNLVFAVIGSANRDEKHFPAPDALDLGREPNKHLAFGFGIHYCLGAPLARLEGQIALLSLVNRVPNLRLQKPDKPVRFRTGFLMHGPQVLPVLL